MALNKLHQLGVLLAKLTVSSDSRASVSVFSVFIYLLNEMSTIETYNRRAQGNIVANQASLAC